MAKLNKTPKALTIIDFLRPVFAFLFFIGILFSILVVINNGTFAVAAICVTISLGFSYLTFSCLYYIVKAACIYIEKEENNQ